MVAILGPPPLDFLQRSDKSEGFWDRDGEHFPMFKISNSNQCLMFYLVGRKMDKRRPNPKYQSGNCRAASGWQGEEQLSSFYQKDVTVEA